MPSARGKPALWEILLIVLISAVAVWRISSTFDVLNQTIDEPAHIATGMEWLDHGRYQIEHLHPPLARIAVAIGPYLLGSRLPEGDGMVHLGNVILYGSEDYFRTLTAARWGIVPFFLLALGAVWLWTRELFGRDAALGAALLFSFLPETLGHGGVATTDMAGAATLVTAYFLLDRWLRRPGWATGLAAGLGTGAALLSKLSAIVFLPLGLLVIGGVAAWTRRRHLRRWLRIILRPLSMSALLLLLTASLVVWGGYRFSVAPVAEVEPRLDRELEQLHGEGVARSLLQRIGREVSLPAPEFFAGIHRVRIYNAAGHNAFLLGETRQDGWWYFYPVALLTKTPIAFLALVGTGVVVLTRRSGSRARLLLPFFLALLVLAVGCTARLNLGLRYILPIYPLLAICAGFGLAFLLRSRRVRIPGAILLCWFLVASAVAHPDYLSYFNEPARPFDDRILLDSNLDWGQDLDRLGRRLEEIGAEEVALSYFGSAWPTEHVEAIVHPLHLGVFTRGWVAISEMNLKGIGFGLAPAAGGGPAEGFAWLDAFGPPEMIGHSIRLYNVVPDERLEPLLVPFWIPRGLEAGDDVRWLTRISLPVELRLFATAAADRRWRAEPGRPEPVLPRENILTGLALFTPRGEIAPGGTLIVERHEGDRVLQGLFLPLVPESRMRQSLAFPPFPGDDEQAVLRLWSLEWREQSTAVVRLAREDETLHEERIELRRQTTPAPWIAPLYAEAALPPRVPAGAVLTVDLIDGRGWGIVFPEDASGFVRIVEPLE